MYLRTLPVYIAVLYVFNLPSTELATSQKCDVNVFLVRLSADLSNRGADTKPPSLEPTALRIYGKLFYLF